MAFGTPNFPEALWPGIQEWFGNDYTEWPALWQNLVKEVSSEKQFEKYQGITEFGLAAVKNQGQTIDYQDPYQGFQKEIVNVNYAVGTTITYEMMKFDQYSLFQSLPQQLAKSVRRTEETVVHNVLNTAFSTATVPSTTADGQSLLNSAHILVASTGTTLSNIPATASDFSQSALEQMYIDVGRFVDDQNLPIVVQAMKLVVPVESQHLARKVLETEYEVASGNNTINPVSKARMPLDLVITPYITDTDSWYIRTDRDDGILFQEVDAVRLKRDNEFDTENLKFAALRFFGVAPVNYLGWYGSPGA
jgi:phage major head subunit gpT-like protein